MSTTPTVLRLVPPPRSIDTIKTLEHLLAEAKAGHLIGLAWISLHPGHGYNVDVTGEAAHDPEFVLGLTKVLETQLEKLIGSR